MSSDNQRKLYLVKDQGGNTKPETVVTQELPVQAPGQTDRLASLLEFMQKQGGSDLHISANSRARIRIRGIMRTIKLDLTDRDVQELISPYLSDKHLAILAKEQSVDFSFRKDNIGVFRVNVFRQRHGLAFVARHLPEKPPTLESLDQPSIVKRTCYSDGGLVLVTGPTGSGKSTTLAAMIDEINRNQYGHIITLEDPIEYLHDSKRCMINQRSLGDHFVSFASGLRAALREDPDVILVGEMRDRETMEAAIHAAETGHLVLSTLHTGSAAKTIDRILNSFPAGERDEIRSVLAETLRLVISQKLVPNKNRSRLRLFQDILVNTRAVANLIREGKTFLIENAMQTSRDEGMMLMDAAIRQAAEEGSIRMADAHEMANDKRIIEDSEKFLRDEFGILETVESLGRDEFESGPGPTNEESGDNERVRLSDEERLARIMGNKRKAIFGLPNLVAELKPGFKRGDDSDKIRAKAKTKAESDAKASGTKPDEAFVGPLHIKKIKTG